MFPYETSCVGKGKHATDVLAVKLQDSVNQCCGCHAIEADELLTWQAGHCRTGGQDALILQSTKRHLVCLSSM